MTRGLLGPASFFFFNFMLSWSSFTAMELWKLVWLNRMRQSNFRVGWSIKIPLSVNGIGCSVFLYIFRSHPLACIISSVNRTERKVHGCTPAPFRHLLSLGYGVLVVLCVFMLIFFNLGHIWISMGLPKRLTNTIPCLSVVMAPTGRGSN